MKAWSEENCLANTDGRRPWKYAARCTSPWWKQTAAHPFSISAVFPESQFGMSGSPGLYVVDPSLKYASV